jgi:hypothetical protein
MVDNDTIVIRQLQKKAGNSQDKIANIPDNALKMMIVRQIIRQKMNQ